MKCAFLFVAVAGFVACAFADDITTLDGQKYGNVRDVSLKPNGLFFVAEANGNLKGVTVPYANLPGEIKEKYHYDPFELGLTSARQTQSVVVYTNMAYSLATLDQAKARAKAEGKLLGFVMVWDSMFDHRANPMRGGTYNDLSHFYLAFHDSLVLVFVHHETELGKVPDAVKAGFFGPDEGGFAPNLAVVTADCSQFVCEIPLGGGQGSTGYTREPVFRQKIEVIKKFLKDHPNH